MDLYGRNNWPRVYKLEFVLKLKIKRNDWLLEDTCLQAANHRAFFSLINKRKKNQRLTLFFYLNIPL